MSASRGDIVSIFETNNTLLKTAKYKGTQVVVRSSNIRSLSLTRQDIVELKEVRTLRQALGIQKIGMCSLGVSVRVQYGLSSASVFQLT